MFIPKWKNSKIFEANHFSEKKSVGYRNYTHKNAYKVVTFNIVPVT